MPSSKPAPLVNNEESADLCVAPGIRLVVAEKGALGNADFVYSLGLSARGLRKEHCSVQGSEGREDSAHAQLLCR